jgi:hypothetical protein
VNLSYIIIDDSITWRTQPNYVTIKTLLIIFSHGFIRHLQNLTIYSLRILIIDAVHFVVTFDHLCYSIF